MRVSIWPYILCVKKTMTQYVVFFGCSVTALRYGKGAERRGPSAWRKGVRRKAKGELDR